MSKIQVNLSELISEARKLAEEYPDVVYTNLVDNRTMCSYVHGGPDDKGCIIGQAAKRCNQELYELFGTLEAGKSFGIGIFSVLNNDKIDKNYSLLKIFSTEIWWLVGVQSKQDEGYTWSNAVKWADKHYQIKK